MFIVDKNQKCLTFAHELSPSVDSKEKKGVQP